MIAINVHYAIIPVFQGRTQILSPDTTKKLKFCMFSPSSLSVCFKNLALIFLFEAQFLTLATHSVCNAQKITETFPAQISTVEFSLIVLREINKVIIEL